MAEPVVPELDFDGDVVAVTGAGRGMGRVHALELARRGARVVVNDIARRSDGHGHLADEVVDEIRSSGGEAIASTATVATPDGGASITETALSRWGRLDAVVSNATTVRHLPFDEMAVEDLDAVLDVKLRGAVFVLQPAYKAMKAAGGGRILAVTSLAGMLGSAGQANYAAANAGLIGLVRTIALEGAAHGIKANLLSPGAINVRAEQWKDQLGFPPEVLERLSPEAVSPMVSVLAHRSCPCSSQILCAWAGAFARSTITINQGWCSDTAVPTAEDVAAHWAAITTQDSVEDPEPDAYAYAQRNFRRLFGSRS